MENQTYSLINNGHYQCKSVSTIEKLSNSNILSIFSADQTSDDIYKLNLQTVDKLSNVVDFYIFGKDNLNTLLIEPLSHILENHNDVYTRDYENYIPWQRIPAYKFPKLLHGKLYDKVHSTGTTMKIGFNFSMEDSRFVVIDSFVTLKNFLSKKSPEEIQPNRIILGIPECRELVEILKSI